MARGTRLFSIRPGITLKGRRFLGIRGWAGKPTHPPLTDIPIASYVLVAAMDVVSYVAARGNPAGQPGAVAHDFFVAGTIVLIAGGVVSLATATTGFWDWWKGQARRKTGPLGQAHHTQVWRTANWHMAVMVTVTVIVAVDIALRLVQFDRHAAQLPTMILSVLAVDSWRTARPTAGRWCSTTSSTSCRSARTARSGTRPRSISSRGRSRRLPRSGGAYDRHRNATSTGVLRQAAGTRRPYALRNDDHPREER